MRCHTCGEDLEPCNFKCKRTGFYTQNCKSCLLKNYQNAYIRSRLKHLQDLNRDAFQNNERLHQNYQHVFVHQNGGPSLRQKTTDDGEEEYVFQPLK